MGHLKSQFHSETQEGEGSYICVIFSTFGTDPPDEIIREGARRNTDGAGVAWQDTHDGVAVVRWRKGITDVEEVIEMVRQGMPHPYMIHFRKKSSGEIDPSLTHPFPLEDDVPLALEGYTTRGVLAHNGTWVSWERECAPVVFGLGRRLPHGLWSDSRMLAYAAAHFGPTALHFLDWGGRHTGRIGILYPRPSQRAVMFNPSEWTKKEGFWMSQDMEKSIIITPDWRDEIGTGYMGTHGFREASFRNLERIRAGNRRFEANGTPMAPQMCPSCANEGDVNYQFPTQQWCKECHKYFDVVQLLLPGGQEEGEDKKKTASSKASSQPSSEEAITRADLLRIASDMFVRRWWVRPAKATLNRRAYDDSCAM